MTAPTTDPPPYGGSTPTARPASSMAEQELWRVQLWLGDYLIEEHVAPTALAQQYAHVINLWIHGRPGRHLRCQRITGTTQKPAGAGRDSGSVLGRPFQTFTEIGDSP